MGVTNPSDYKVTRQVLRFARPTEMRFPLAFRQSGNGSAGNIKLPKRCESTRKEVQPDRRVNSNTFSSGKRASRQVRYNVIFVSTMITFLTAGAMTDLEAAQNNKAVLHLTD